MRIFDCKREDELPWRKCSAIIWSAGPERETPAPKFVLLNYEKDVGFGMMNPEFIRTALFVPGNRPERIEKALNSGADAIIIDLEDTIPLNRKEETRTLVREAILKYKGRGIIVRVNSLNSGFLERDLDEVVIKNLGCIMLPKVETSSDVREINRLLVEREEKKGIPVGAIAVIPLIESARAVQNVFPIVSEETNPRRIFTAAFGATDYTLDLGTEVSEEGMELIYPRSRIAIACRAAGIKPPLDTPCLNLKDVETFRAEARRAKQMGFQGKQCVHPDQVGPGNDIFTPTQNEILFASRVIQAYEEAEAGGLGAIQLEGKVIDSPVVERSRHILKLASLMSLK